MANELVKWDEIERQIQTTKDIKELSKIKNVLEGIKVMASQLGGSKSIQNRAALYSIEVEMKMGQIYKDAPSETGKHQTADASAVSSKQAIVAETGRELSVVKTYATESKSADAFDDYKKEVLASIETYDCSSTDFRRFAKEKQPDKAAAHPAILPPGIFDIIYSDPPWKYRNSGFDMSAAKQFPTMETSAICAYRDSKGKPIQDSIADNAVCFMWATNPLLPDALDVLKAWGFEYKTNLVWVKDSHTAGFYVYGMHELLLIGVKGNNMLPDEKGKPKSVLHGKSGRHSEKPVEAYEAIEAMYPGHSYLEVFARTNRKGWANIGNQN